MQYGQHNLHVCWAVGVVLFRYGLYDNSDTILFADIGTINVFIEISCYINNFGCLFWAIISAHADMTHSLSHRKMQRTIIIHF